jgi:hypothetical protein
VGLERAVRGGGGVGCVFGLVAMRGSRGNAGSFVAVLLELSKRILYPATLFLGPAGSEVEARGSEGRKERKRLDIYQNSYAKGVDLFFYSSRERYYSTKLAFAAFSCLCLLFPYPSIENFSIQFSK